ncbi:MAG: TonB-dependent receptor [Betaproteobacteria bacterium]
MHSPKVLAFSALTAALVVLASTDARSADTRPSGDGPNMALQEVVVTAQKISEKLQDVPMSVTALPGDVLDRLQARSLADFLTQIPGLAVQQISGGENRLTLRGLNAGGVGATVGTYVDDAPFGSSTATINGSTVTSNWDTWDLARIEVLRGPQGTLYGANSEGGLVKYVTNAPEMGHYSAAVEVGGDSIDGGGSGGSVRATVNTPLGSNAALRLSAVDVSLPGWVNDPSIGASDVNRGTKKAARVSVLWSPLSGLSVQLTAFVQKMIFDGTPQVDATPALAPLNGITQTRLIGEPNTYNLSDFIANINWANEHFSVTSVTSSSKFDQRSVIDISSGAFSPPLNNQQLAGVIFAGQTLGMNFTNNASMTRVTEELRFASVGHQTLEWQIGGFYSHETASLFESEEVFAIPGGAPTGLPALALISVPSTYSEYSGFGNTTYHLSEKIDLLAGARYATDKQTNNEDVTGLLLPPGGLHFATPSSGSATTYSFAPRWHVTTETMAYARVASGYRPGGPNVLPPNAPPDVPREYGADSTVNYELGVKSEFLDRRVSVDIAAYRVNWKKIQIIEVIDNTGINGNGGTARSQGLEWTIRAAPTDGLQLSWVGATTDAKLTSDALAFGGTSGDRLAYVPKFSTSIDGQYEWKLSEATRAYLGGTWSYSGDQMSDFSASAPRVTLASYNTFSARVGVAFNRVTLNLSARNIGNSRGIVNYSAPGALIGASQVAFLQPRTIGLTADYRY